MNTIRSITVASHIKNATKLSLFCTSFEVDIYLLPREVDIYIHYCLFVCGLQYKTAVNLKRLLRSAKMGGEGNRRSINCCDDMIFP